MTSHGGSHLGTVIELIENLEKLYIRESSLRDLEGLLGRTDESDLKDWLRLLLRTSGKHSTWSRAATCGLIGKLAVKHGPAVQRYGKALVGWWEARLKDLDLDGAVTEAVASCVGTVIKHGQVKALTIYLRSFFGLAAGYESREQIGAGACLRAVFDQMPPSVMYTLLEEDGQGAGQQQFGDRLCIRMIQTLDNSNRKHQLKPEGAIQLIQALQILILRFPDVVKRHVAAFQTLLVPGLQSDRWKLRLEVAKTINILVQSIELDPLALDTLITILQDCRYDKIQPVRNEIQQILLHAQSIAPGVTRSVPNVARPIRSRSRSENRPRYVVDDGELDIDASDVDDTAAAVQQRRPVVAPSSSSSSSGAAVVTALRQDLSALHSDWTRYAHDFRNQIGRLIELASSAHAAAPPPPPPPDQQSLADYFDGLHVLLDYGRPIPDLAATIEKLGQLSIQYEHPDVADQAGVLLTRIHHSLLLDE